MQKIKQSNVGHQVSSQTFNEYCEIHVKHVKVDNCFGLFNIAHLFILSVDLQSLRTQVINFEVSLED
jgi:hypothetical protein